MRSSSVLRADVNLVLVPVTVTDRHGATLNGLTKADFTLLDNASPQHIISLTAQDAPCTVGIVLDISGSMRNVLDLARQAVRSFLTDSNPEDEFFYLTVSSRPEIHGLTRVDAVVSLAAAVHTGGSTALIDTVYLALDQLRKLRTHPRHRRALLIVSDGMDNHNRFSKAELMRAASEGDVQIYSIAIAHVNAYKKAVEVIEERRGMRLLSDLSTRTGGLCFLTRDSSDAFSAAAKARRALRDEYVIAYMAPAAQPGKWRKIRVKVNQAAANIHARAGYYAH